MPISELDPRDLAKEPLYFYIGAGLSRSAGICGWHELVERIHGYRVAYESYAGATPIADNAQANSQYLREFVSDVAHDGVRILVRGSTDRRVFGRTVVLNLLLRHDAANGWPVNEQRLQLHAALWSCRPHGLLTTNYDTLIERTCPADTIAYLRVYRYTASFLPFILSNPTFLLKLHGDVNDIGTMVFDPEYAWRDIHGEFHGESGEFLKSVYRAAIMRGHMIYLGCGFRDRTITSLHGAVGSRPPGQLRRVAIVPDNEVASIQAGGSMVFHDIQFYTYPSARNPYHALLHLLRRLGSMRATAPREPACPEASDIRRSLFEQPLFSDIRRGYTKPWTLEFTDE
jgi:hypothetical protein